MGEGTGQPDNTPRPDDTTFIGGETGGMPAGHDAAAAEYQAELDAINDGLEEPAAP